jgi:hypothetical protein
LVSDLKVRIEYGFHGWEPVPSLLLGVARVRNPLKSCFLVQTYWFVLVSYWKPYEKVCVCREFAGINGLFCTIRFSGIIKGELSGIASP